MIQSLSTSRCQICFFKGGTCFTLEWKSQFCFLLAILAWGGGGVNKIHFKWKSTFPFQENGIYSLQKNGSDGGLGPGGRVKQNPENGME